MSWLEQQLGNASGLNTITHLGAGLCSELDIYLRCNPQQINLVEPNPEILPELRRRVAEHDFVKILPVAVSSSEGRESLNIFNYADLSSLRTPTDLIELLPGLTQIEQAVVDVVAAQRLVKQIELDEEDNNWLIIDAPGEEFAIIESLTSHKQLHQFDRIVLRAGAETFYKGAHCAKEITDHLKRQGYLVEGSIDSDDREWPRIHFRLNIEALKCKTLKQENEELRQENTSLQDEIQALKKSEYAFEKKQKEFNNRVEEVRKLRARVSELENETADCQQRHKLLEEELIKAEAQIDLIKNLFISDERNASD